VLTNGRKELPMTTITLPTALAEQLQRRAAAEQRTIQAVAITLLEAGLRTEATPPAPSVPTAPLDDPELLALVARIKATPPNPANIIPAKGDLAAVLLTLEAVEPDADYDLAAEIAALQEAEAELRTINRADDIAEGRG
jgi:plasmid stability protein